jgi:hypothetical protein
VFWLRISNRSAYGCVTPARLQVDGCATFWKRSKFILVENFCIEFNDIARQVLTRVALCLFATLRLAEFYASIVVVAMLDLT